MQSEIGIIVIGRNEGERLRACLASVVGRALVVYADSASTDGSAELAKEIGAEVVYLDDSSRLTAARGRNAGYQCLREINAGLEFVQFIDGDCILIEGWLETARDALRSDAKLAAICGRLRERFPARSIYNAMIDVEWNVPAGPAKSVGGVAMFRAAALDACGGFNPAIAAGEEPELCLRLRQAGWKILRLGSEMASHDANILTFSDWWKRQIRSGFGAMEVFTRTRDSADGGERLFSTMIVGARVWTGGGALALVAITPLFAAAFGLKIAAG